jgi:hypothetical protein
MTQCCTNPPSNEYDQIGHRPTLQARAAFPNVGFETKYYIEVGGSNVRA